MSFRSLLTGLLGTGLAFLLLGCDGIVNKRPVADFIWHYCAEFTIPEEIISSAGNLQPEIYPFPYPLVCIVLDASPSYDPDGRIVKYLWDLGDYYVWPASDIYPHKEGLQGLIQWISGKFVAHDYVTEMPYQITLKVIDNKGAKGQISKTITFSLPEED